MFLNLTDTAWFRFLVVSVFVSLLVIFGVAIGSVVGASYSVWVGVLYTVGGLSVLSVAVGAYGYHQSLFR